MKASFVFICTREYKEYESTRAHTGLIPKVILLKLFLDMLSRSPADNVTTFFTGGDAFVVLHHVAYVSFASELFRNFESDPKNNSRGIIQGIRLIWRIE